MLSNSQLSKSLTPKPIQSTATEDLYCWIHQRSWESSTLLRILFLTAENLTMKKAALEQTEKLLKEGAEIIDIGPQSTRPNAEFLSEEEISRIGNRISQIKKEFPEALISLDTFYADTVKFGYNEGIDIINDISGGQYDEKMFDMLQKQSFLTS
jgi:dihydropteroate synthase